MNDAEFADYQKTIDDVCKEYNIPEHLSQFEKERRMFAAFFREYYIPETLEKTKKAERYRVLEKFIRPSLFRYRKIEPHTIEALKGGYISVAKPSRMKATGDEADSQIIIDYEKIQSNFSLYLSLDISHWEKWAFAGKPFPDEALVHISQEMQMFLKHNQGFMKDNLQLKPQLKLAQNYLQVELAKLTPNSGTAVLDVLQKTGYIASFCETVCDADMWEKFAKNKKDDEEEYGYALEYDFMSLNLNYSNPDKVKNFIVLPTIYGEEYDATNLMVYTFLSGWLKRVVGKQRVGHKPIALPDELGWIRGYFYKKEKYRKEHEWRLVTPILGEIPKIIGDKKDDDFGNVYIPPKAIYYALKITDYNFERLDKIAVAKGLARYKMVEDKETGMLKPMPL